jgi:hypothetical protein
MTAGRNPHPGDRVPAARAQRSSSSRAPDAIHASEPDCRHSRAAEASTGWTAGTWTSSPTETCATTARPNRPPSRRSTSTGTRSRTGAARRTAYRVCPRTAAACWDGGRGPRREHVPPRAASARCPRSRAATRLPRPTSRLPWSAYSTIASVPHLPTGAFPVVSRPPAPERCRARR